MAQPECSTGEILVIDTVYEAKVPKDTNVYVADIVNQRGFDFGDTEQIAIPEAVCLTVFC